MKIRKVNESIDLKEAAEDKIPDIDPKDSVAEIADAIADQVEIATGEEKTVADSDAKAAAQVEAKKVTDAAQVSIDQARKESEKQLRQEVSTYALEIAEKVIRENLQSNKAQTELVDKLLNEAENNN